MKLTLLVFFLLGASVWAQTSPVLLVSYPDHPVAPLFMPVIEQSYKKLGINISYLQAPLVRRLVMLNKGQVDADLGARETVLDRYPNVLRVGPALIKGEVLLVCREQRLCSADVMHNPKLAVYAELSGWDLLDDALDKPITVKRGSLQEYVSVVDMFNKGRTEYIVIIKMENNVQMPIPADTTSVKLADIAFYHHIHKKHQKLAEPLALAIEHQLKLMSKTTAAQPD